MVKSIHVELINTAIALAVFTCELARPAKVTVVALAVAFAVRKIVLVPKLIKKPTEPALFSPDAPTVNGNPDTVLVEPVPIAFM
jgi:hypothetical protein